MVKEYANSLISTSCKLLIDLPTHLTPQTDTLIDHIYTNDSRRSITSGVALSDLSDHLPIFASIYTKTFSKKPEREQFIRDMSNFDSQLFLTDLANNLSEIDCTNQTSVHTEFDRFYHSFKNTIDAHAPKIKASRKMKKLSLKPWLSPAILKSIKRKNKMFKTLCHKFDPILSANYKKYRNILHKTIDRAKQTYYFDYIAVNKNNSQNLWKLVKQLTKIKQATSTTPSFIRDNNEIITDDKSICEKFNEYFANIGARMAQQIKPNNNTSDCINPTLKRSPNSLFLTPGTSQEVSSLILALNERKAIRKNDVETKFIKISSAVIAPVLSNLFNSCLNQGEYPDSLKVAEVIPVFKKGKHDSLSDYRPISLLSQFNKIFEKMLFNRIYNYLEKHKLLNPYQYGFRENRSTIHAISHIYDDLLQNIDQNLYSCSIFLDLSKAFDTVDHQILLKKMENYFGIRGICLKLLESYLTNRKQYTYVLNCTSHLRSIFKGVPQGSSLGPLFFLLYVNDLPAATSFKSTLFADDTYLTLSGNNLLTLENQVNNELSKLDIWLKQNKLFLNYSKSNYMLINKYPHKQIDSKFMISINSNPLARVNTVKYLGIYIDDNLKWTSHIRYMSLQLAKYCGLFYRIRKFLTKDVLRMLYYSLIYSRITYGITVWGTASKTTLHELEVRLNNIIRAIAYSNMNCHVSPLYNNLNLLKLEDIYKLEVAKFMYQFMNDKLPQSFYSKHSKIQEFHDYNTRHSENVMYFFPRTNKMIGRKQLLIRGLKLWKSIDSNTRDLHWFKFKKTLKSNFIKNY